MFKCGRYFSGREGRMLEDFWAEGPGWLRGRIGEKLAKTRVKTGLENFFLENCKKGVALRGETGRMRGQFS